MKKPVLFALLLAIGISGTAQSLINQISFRFKDSQWETSSRTDFYYDRNGNDSLDEYLVYFQNLGTFQKRQLRHHYFNPTGRMDSLLRERWEGIPGAYVPRFRQLNHFNNQGLLDTTLELMNTTGNWFMDGRTSYSYNSANAELRRTFEYHTNAIWEPVSLDSSFYDSQGQLERKRSYSYDSLGNLYLSRERHYKYDINGKIDRIIHFRQLSSGWDSNSVEQYIYAPNGILSEERYILILPGSHNPTTRKLYTYLANGAIDTTYFSSLMWDSTNTWITNSKVGYTYSNNPVNIEEYFSAIEIYPNPVEDLLSLNNMPLKEKRICLRSLDGLLIRQFTIQERSFKLPTSYLKPGVYLLQLNIGELTYFRNIIKL